ncbi:hypothetical protein LS81_010775 [Helicobacter trogontum]|uniref:Uncharacterized protein n=1 Tax=Helicobacter trogontum TaxID=50960 RepID=A0A4U8S149_9HELI|nr:hypothetical protein LS81_010775 [Helicobacter trogontum]
MQNNKKQIQKLKDNAELAMAAYGYFHLANESYKPEENSKDWKRLEHFGKLYKNNNLDSLCLESNPCSSCSSSCRCFL